MPDFEYTFQCALEGDDTCRFQHVIVKSRSPCTSMARQLVKMGYPENSQLEFYRGDQLCLSGMLGRLAGLITVETDRGLRFMQYKPFPGVSNPT